MTSGVLSQAIRAGELVSFCFARKVLWSHKEAWALLPALCWHSMAELFEKLDLWSQGPSYSSCLTPWLSSASEGRQASLRIEKGMIKCNPSYLSITPKTEGSPSFSELVWMGEWVSSVTNCSSSSLMFTRSTVH